MCTTQMSLTLNNKNNHTTENMKTRTRAAALWSSAYLTCTRQTETKGTKALDKKLLKRSNGFIPHVGLSCAGDLLPQQLEPFPSAGICHLLPQSRVGCVIPKVVLPSLTIKFTYSIFTIDPFSFIRNLFIGWRNGLGAAQGERP